MTSLLSQCLDILTTSNNTIEINEVTEVIESMKKSPSVLVNDILVVFQEAPESPSKHQLILILLSQILAQTWTTLSKENRESVKELLLSVLETSSQQYHFTVSEAIHACGVVSRLQLGWIEAIDWIERNLFESGDLGKQLLSLQLMREIASSY